ncbi:hypothetical protein RUND412_009750 [Rhizina undulata]
MSLNDGLRIGEKQRLVIAVDFGTTFSGVAYTFTDAKDKYEVINQWPGSGNSTKDKVPTEILYHDEDPVSGIVRLGPNGIRRHQWGHGIVPRGRKNIEPLKWFKLLLHDRNPFAGGEFYGKGANDRDASSPELSQNIESMFATLSLSQSGSSEKIRLTADLEERVTNSTPAARTAVLLTKMNLPPVEVVTDYLRSLREHTMSVIERRFHSEFIRRTKTEYVLTVPAVWSDSAKALTVQAARNAGFGEHGVNFNLIGEPEAAAAYTLQAINLEQGALKEGDTFVVCDAGGGTVDLVSYTIVQLNPMAVSEVVGGSGGLCGSVFVNQMFEEYMRNILGDDTINRMKPVSKNEMIRQWEEKVKFKFADAEDEDYYDVQVPGVHDNDKVGLAGGWLSLTREAVRNIFDPVVDRIVALVDGQINEVKTKGQNVAAILLVGGFGSSEYLCKRLSEHLFLDHKTRGALIRGLDGSFVKDQIARRHYGLSVSLPYIAGKGWEKYKEWDPAEERWEVPNQMQWIVDKGMVLEDEKTVSMSVYRTVFRQNYRVFTIELLACNIDERPSWNNPSEVFEVCKLKADLSRLPLDTFQEDVSSAGKQYWNIFFSLEMKISSGMITFSMNFEGKNYGSVDATFY